jgi:DNA-binding protein HU-beta
MSNKKDIIKKLAKRTLLTQKESEMILNELFEIVEEEVLESGEVKFIGFGRFFLYKHAPRPVRNPLTKEEMTLKEYKSLKFKPSNKLKDRLKKKTTK